MAEVYVEEPREREDFYEDGSSGDDDSTSYFEDEIDQMVGNMSNDESENQTLRPAEFYSGPSKKGKETSENGKETVVLKAKKLTHRPLKRKNAADEEDHSSAADEEDHSSEDSDYIPGDACPSEEDQEAADIMKKFKEFKRKLKRGECATLDDVVLEGSTCMPSGFELHEDDGNVTPYAKSSDDEATEEDEGSEAGLISADGLPRFKKTKGTPVFSLGMKFSSKQQFKKAIIRYGLAERKVIIFLKDEPTRVRAKCDWQHCPWVILLSKNTRTPSWQVVTYNDYHTCPPRRDNKLVTARRIAERYEKFIMANPTWNYVSMKQTVQEEMFCDVNIAKLKRAKALVMHKVLDATERQYQRIYDYQLELLRSNPGSTIIVVKEPEVEPPTFQRMYICFDALKKGFLAGSRRVVGLDGCFFKGTTIGELLCAIGRDANNQMYPIAWAVVEKENNDSWDWFCNLLGKDLCVGDGSDWVFISDQQKGILTAVQKMFPMAEHRNCARHIYANWKKHFTEKEWQKLFWECAKAPCVMLFNLATARLARETKEGAQAILNTHPQHWSRAWFRLGSNCDSVDNNLCESFNKWIIEARFFPIITMLETIRRKVMVRIHDNITKSARWNTIICPNILRKLNAYIKISGNCHAICNGTEKFEVKQWDNRFTVDLVKKECSCRYWQLSGLPCPHAISCIFLKTNTLDEYIANCYCVEEFNKTYAHCLNPVEGMNNWPVSDMPKLKAPGYIRRFRMPGRPRKERKGEPTEPPRGTKMSKVGTVIRCSKCKQVGHNKTSCDKINTSNTTGITKPHVDRTKKIVKTNARATVRTNDGDSATMKVTATSGTVNINSGSASAHVSSSAPMKNQKTSKNLSLGPMLLLPPWESANL